MLRSESDVSPESYRLPSHEGGFPMLLSMVVAKTELELSRLKIDDIILITG